MRFLFFWPINRARAFPEGCTWTKAASSGRFLENKIHKQRFLISSRIGFSVIVESSETNKFRRSVLFLLNNGCGVVSFRKKEMNCLQHCVMELRNFETKKPRTSETNEPIHKPRNLETKEPTNQETKKRAIKKFNNQETNTPNIQMKEQGSRHIGNRYTKQNDKNSKPINQETNE